MPASGPGWVDCCAEARWIAAETGYETQVVHEILIADIRYLQAIGIAGGPPPEDHEVHQIGE